MRKESAAACLYEQKDLPVFQNRMYSSAEEAKACPTGDVRLVQDAHTGLFHNEAFRPELVVYDHHYQNEQAVSPLFQRHLETVADVIERRLGRESIVEVGCGKGFFLEMLLQRGVDVSGFDPTYEGNNSRIVKEFFRPGLGIRATGLVLRHVLEHIPQPYEFLQGLQQANGGGGLVYIEVPLLDWICEHRAWFDVFYEHVNYFRISDFHRMFGSVVETGRTFGGQYLYVVANLATLRPPVFDPADRFTFPADFAEGLSDRSTWTTPAAIWGGASKGVIFALLKSRHDQPVSVVIDINPAKQGKYLPGTGLLVQAPGPALAQLPKGASIYVMNSNYLGEIRAMTAGAFNCIPVDRG
jgi:hypothetical protein